MAGFIPATHVFDLQPLKTVGAGREAGHGG
jgi:hypothetical protein